MKLSDLAMSSDGNEEEAAEGMDEEMPDVFEDAAIEAFDLFKQGKKAEAAAALKGAIESCVADYLADDSEPEEDEE